MQPRDAAAPKCYLVDGEKLTEYQISLLAELVFELWQPECESIEMAIAYIRDGLPLNCGWFNGVATDMRAFVPDNFDLLPVDEPREEDYEVCPDCDGDEDECPTCGGSGYL